MKLGGDSVVVILLMCLLTCCLMTSANVVLIGNNVTKSFDDIEANFGQFFTFNLFFLFFFFGAWLLRKLGK